MQGMNVKIIETPRSKILGLVLCGCENQVSEQIT